MGRGFFTYCHSLLQTQIYLFLVAYFFHSIISSTLFPPDNCKAYYLISFKSLSTCYLIREDLPDHSPYEKWQLPPALCFLVSFTLLYFSFFYLSPDIHVFFSPPSRIEAPGEQGPFSSLSHCCFYSPWNSAWHVAETG